MTRRAFEPSEDQRKMVAQAYAMGMRQIDICQLIRNAENKPLDLKTLRKYFRPELIQGRSQVEFNVRSTAYKIATDLNHPKVATMNIWLQKTLLGINETTVHEITGPDGEPISNAPNWVVIVNKD